MRLLGNTRFMLNTRGLRAAFRYLLLALVMSSAHAQPYVGASVGYSAAQLPSSSRECDNCSSGEYHYKAMVYKAMAGYRSGAWAVEGGAGSLSHYATHNVRPPLPSDIRQEIDTDQLYLQAMRYISLAPKLEGYGSLGLVRVRMKNHEYGYNDPSLQFVEQVNYDTRYRPLYGLGLAYQIGGATSIRAEVTHVRHVAMSHWTLEQNVTAGWLGLQVDLR